jgi:hypothetical protein
MDVATVVITASFIIVVLQVITLYILFNTRSRMHQGSSVAAPIHDTQDFRKRRGEDTKFIKRPEQEQRPKMHVPPQQPQEVDHVEKTLRDINLRLKNAERDQEKARKKIRDVMTEPQQNQKRFDQQRPRRDDNFRGQDRPRHQFNQNRGPENRNPDRSQPPDFSRPPEQPPAPPKVAAALPVRNDIPVVQAQAPVQQAPPQVQKAQAPVQKENIEILPENTEILHGRKVLVRRRVLKGEEETGQTANGNGVVAAVPDAGPAQSSAPETPVIASEKTDEPKSGQQPDADQSAVQNIQFGR